LYQPFEPLGALGLNVIVVDGGVVSDLPSMLNTKSFVLPEPSAARAYPEPHYTDPLTTAGAAFTELPASNCQRI